MKRNRDFQRLYSKGKSVVTPTLVVYFRRTKRPYNQLGITTGKKVGNAVCRNRIRRRVREIYRLNEHKMKKGMDIVVVARVRASKSNYATLENNYLKACSKLGILKDIKKSGVSNEENSAGTY